MKLRGRCLVSNILTAGGKRFDSLSRLEAYPNGVCWLHAIATCLYGDQCLFSGLVEKVGNMSATCRPDSQISALLAEMPLLRRHNFDPDTFFVSGFAAIHQIFLFSTRDTYEEFLCKF